MLVTLTPGEDIAALVRGAVATGHGSIVIALVAELDAMQAALARAAVAPLAIAHAPAVRINAVAPGFATNPGTIASAVAFLESAMSTTGQILDLR
jgi:hypothetical protein